MFVLFSKRARDHWRQEEGRANSVCFVMKEAESFICPSFLEPLAFV